MKEKKAKIIFTLVFCIIISCTDMFCTNNAVENTFISSDLAIYPVPDGTPQSSTPVFSVTANQYPVGVFTEDTPWTGKANFAYFNLRDGYNVEVKITPTFSYSKVTVLPESLGITPTKNGSQLAFTVNQIGRAHV